MDYITAEYNTHCRKCGANVATLPTIDVMDEHCSEKCWRDYHGIYSDADHEQAIEREREIDDF